MLQSELISMVTWTTSPRALASSICLSCSSVSARLISPYLEAILSSLIARFRCFWNFLFFKYASYSDLVGAKPDPAMSGIKALFILSKLYHERLKYVN